MKSVLRIRVKRIQKALITERVHNNQDNTLNAAREILGDFRVEWGNVKMSAQRANDRRRHIDDRTTTVVGYDEIGGKRKFLVARVTFSANAFFNDVFE